MKVEETFIKGCFYIEVEHHDDDRGTFMEFYNKDRYPFLPCNEFVQSNYSSSKADVIRGLHLVPFAKLVTCVIGEVFDVVVDMRLNSPTYLKWVSFLLSGDCSKPCKQQVYVPAHCAHGFMAIKDSIVSYYQTDTYKSSVEKIINWKDPKINVAWPLPEGDYKLSSKDAKAGSVGGGKI